jgi:hypothetical protein
MLKICNDVRVSKSLTTESEKIGHNPSCPKDLRHQVTHVLEILPQNTGRIHEYTKNKRQSQVKQTSSRRLPEKFGKQSAKEADLNAQIWPISTTRREHSWKHLNKIM